MKSLVNLNGLLARLMGQRLMNNVVKLNNGHLIQAEEKRDMKSLVDILLPLKEYCDSKGILDLYYIQHPVYGASKYDPQLPAGTVDYFDENRDSLLEILKEKSFKTFDLREEMYNAGMNQYDWVYKTDHHWKMETALWATGKMLEYLVNQGAIEYFDNYYTDLENYNIEAFKDSFLGSRGRRTGSKFTGVDDFTVISPKFETNITVTRPLINQTKSGDFNAVILNKDYMKQINYFEKDPYTLIWYGGNGDEWIFQNEKAPIRKKILFLNSSFFIPVRFFMSLQFYSVYSIFQTAGKTNFKQLLEEYKPDIIVITDIISPPYFKRVMEGF
jgi:hypothetical protein